MTQLKYIALAMHNYHDKNARFPAAVVMGPDGKTPHSWRVELLPYLDDPRGKEVYDRYKLDEPWNSEHNKALLKEGAAWFGSPGEGETGNSAYFVITGPGSMFEADKLPAIKTVSDGLSNTIGVVEAKRPIPWTKPEDIYVDPDKPLPELGGYFEGGFNAAIMDGSVHFLPADIDETVFKKLVTKAGGEVVTIPHGESAGERKARPQLEGQRQTEAHRKLQEIGIALQNYHDAKRHFPSAIVIGPDGKTPHSWRVEILRFLNTRSQSIFARYKLDEPWDSEANQALSKEGAEFFNVSGSSDPENSAFFMVTGPGMMFDADQPAPSARKILDGSSNTIGIVEAKRSIPWMKPEDIRIEVDKPLPELGGIFKNGFHVSLMDSSVVFVPNDTDPTFLKQYFTRAGREPAAGLGMPRGKLRGAQPLTEPATEQNKSGESSKPGDPAKPSASSALAERRQATVHELKLLGLALHNYHDVHKHFPPAVVLGPDGKTPHSWRVELLPYFEDPVRKSIYDRYKLDEPWDSEANWPLIKEGAAFFRGAGQPSSDDCAYFAVVGPGTAFDPKGEPSSVRNIVDGTSQTIGIVEAKRSIPWTKPEDIPFEPEKPLPKFGGFFDEGFNTLFMDGSVHLLPQDLDSEVLKRLLTKAGREPVGAKAGFDQWEAR